VLGIVLPAISASVSASNVVAGIRPIAVVDEIVVVVYINVVVAASAPPATVPPASAEHCAHGHSDSK